MRLIYIRAILIEEFPGVPPKLNSTLDTNLTWLNEILNFFKLRGQGAIKNWAHFIKQSASKMEAIMKCS